MKEMMMLDGNELARAQEKILKQAMAALVIGEVIPDDEELVKGPNGNLVRVKKTDEGKQNEE